MYMDWRAEYAPKNAYLATFAISGIFAYLFSILDPFGPLWNVDKPATVGHFGPK